MLPLLLLLLACARPDAAYQPVGDRAVPSSRATYEELLKLAVRKYDTWQHVWDQKVRPTGSLRPPYQDQVSLFTDDGADGVAPFPVVRLVLNHYAWLGSFTEYGVRLLAAATSCLTAQYVWLQTELLWLSASKLEASAPEPPTDTAELTETFATVRDALLGYARKLDALRGDMKPVAIASSRLVAVKPADYTRVLLSLRDETDRLVDERCVRVAAAELYGHFGDADSYDTLFSDESTWTVVADAVRTVAERSAKMFDGLGYETMSATNWRQIFDYEYQVHSGFT